MSRFSLRLLRSSTFRLAFLGALLFAVTGLGMLGVVRWMTTAVLDHRVDLSVETEMTMLRTLLDQGGMDALAEEVNARANSLQGRYRAYLMQDGQGHALAGNLAVWPKGHSEENGKRLRFHAPETSADPGSPVRATVIELPGGGKLLMGRLQSDRQAFEEVVDRTMLAGAALSLVLGFGVGLLLARRALRRLDQINRTAQTILEGQLRDRVPVGGGGDEFDHLAVNLNVMLDRIERLVEAMRAVTRNIAHDLRTPLNRLRNRLELGLIDQAAEPRQVLADAIGDVDGVLGTFNALLSIARLEGRKPRENFSDIDLDELISGLAELYAPLAEDEGLAFTSGPACGVSLSGDHHLLSQALANLLDNAIKYTPPGGHLHLWAEASDGLMRLCVADDGPGIPPDARAKVVEPFVRLDEARHLPGAGLGLSLVSAIAEAHGGRLLLEDAAPGLRAVLQLTLPKHGHVVNSM
jgi:signal transduction histidine kinase